jgi:hypothetical protein
MTELTYDRSAEDFILEALGLELVPAGHVRYEDGTYVPTLCGKASLRIDNVGAYAHYEEEPLPEYDGEDDVRVVCDHISCIVDWTREEDRQA